MGHLEGGFGRLGAILKAFWLHLGALGGFLKASWGHFKGSWRHLGDIFGHLGALGKIVGLPQKRLWQLLRCVVRDAPFLHVFSYVVAFVHICLRCMILGKTMKNHCFSYSFLIFQGVADTACILKQHSNTYQKTS